MRMTAYVAGAMLLCVLAADSQAGGPRRSRRMSYSNGYQQSTAVQQQEQPVKQASATVSATTGTSCAEALDEVNATRAQRGLKPFIHDPELSKAAYGCAKARAAGLIAGHLPSDFAYLPSGATATSAGCAAWEPSWGWGACCTYDNYTYAGAAWVMGNDGRRYMHLFVR